MYQTSTNVNPSQFTSQTTTTPIATTTADERSPPAAAAAATGNIDYTNSCQNNSYTNELKELDSNSCGAQFNNNYYNNNGLIQPNADLSQQQQYHVNPLVQHPNTDSISLALDEIGAILNSEEFNDSFVDQSNNTFTNQQRHFVVDTDAQRQYDNNQQFLNQQDTDNLYNNQDSFTEEAAATEETKAAIYENLKTIISDNCELEGSNSSGSFHINNMASNARQSNKNTNNNQLKNLFNSIQFDALNNDDKLDKSKQPFVEIIEQPAKCALRFRYKCEGRSAGSLPGVNSTADNKTFPSIRINNYVGRAVVVISCVTKDIPYRAHPHNIVGKEGCKKGICTIVINNEPNMVRSFPSLGIQCVKRKDIEESLSLRESINVDPFRNGFGHKSCTSNIDLNVVRLCFQVFIQGSQANKCDTPLVPVVSEPIHDKKAMSDLIITKLSHCSAPATGGREVILLCDRISKDDIQIRFFEERDGELIWETFTDLAPTDVHKQVAICFKTPKYHNDKISSPVMVRIQLRRLSDNQVSEPRLFQFLPCESDEDVISRKRQKIEWVNMNHNELDSIFQPPGQQLHPHHPHPHQLHHHHIAIQQQLQLQQQQQLPIQQHRLDNPSPSMQQHSPVISHQSQPPPLDQRFNQPLPHHLHQQHLHQHQPQQQHHRQQLQSANSSPSHMSQQQQQQQAQPSSVMIQRQSMNRHQQSAVNDNSTRGTPSPMHQQAVRQQQNSPEQLVHHHLPPHQQQLRQSIDSPEMSVDGNRTPTAMQQQHQTGNDNFTVDNSQNLVVRREIIDNEGKVMRLVDRSDVGGDSLAAAGGPSTSAAAVQTADDQANNKQQNQLSNRQLVLASSLDRIDTAELMRDIAFSSNIDLNLDMGTGNELN